MLEVAMSDAIECSATTLQVEEPLRQRTVCTRQDQDAAVELSMDKGMRAWLQVLGSWVLFANTW